MNRTAIKVEKLSKLYKLGEIGTGSLSHDINRWVARLRGKDDPYTKIGETNDRTVNGNSDYVWALKDINFEVRQGDVLGIIGRNGAGKSTLLKILSKITSPSEGEIKIRGRIASLLEVGTGFHPELTGRENIYLNGAILGMTKLEIRKKFDEIVDFAGVERYIDTPVKRYSSGMYVRLAFAVAAFLEPEILIVDEVLAVGDSEFQKKCIGRMQDVSRNDGRTILFVSHNIAAIRSLCNMGLLMQNGRIQQSGDIDSVINSYLQSQSENRTKRLIDSFNHLDKDFKLINVVINGSESSQINIMSRGTLEIRIDFELYNSEQIVDIEFHIEKDEQKIASFAHYVFNEPKTFKIGMNSIKMMIQLPSLLNGVYVLKIDITHPLVKFKARAEHPIYLEVFDNKMNYTLNNSVGHWGKVIMEGAILNRI